MGLSLAALQKETLEEARSTPAGTAGEVRGALPGSPSQDSGTACRTAQVCLPPGTPEPAACRGLRTESSCCALGRHAAGPAAGLRGELRAPVCVRAGRKPARPVRRPSPRASPCMASGFLFLTGQIVRGQGLC